MTSTVQEALRDDAAGPARGRTRVAKTRDAQEAGVMLVVAIAAIASAMLIVLTPHPASFATFAPTAPPLSREASRPAIDSGAPDAAPRCCERCDHSSASYD